MWTIFGHGAAQLIRLASSLVLTRLLFPEAFGLMALVWMIMIGLEMLSDVGIGTAIIRDKRGDDPVFLNTAWTLQVIRGFVLWIAACVFAFPLAKIYGEPLLAYLVPVAGLTALILGFCSTSSHTLRRRMQFRPLVFLEFWTQLVAFIAVVLGALMWPSVWALVGGALIGRLTYTLSSHAFLGGDRNRFYWEATSARTLFGFGKWIFLSSAVTFVSNQGDRMLLGRYLTMTQFGVYSIAIMLSEAVHAVVTRIVQGVLYPAYGRIVQNEPERFPEVLNRSRLGIDVFLVFPIACLLVLGKPIVELLYDPRYYDAGWIFQLLCIRLVMSVSLVNIETSLFALGYSKYGFLQGTSRAIWILAGIPIGWSLFEIEGVVWVVALSEIPAAVVLWGGLVRHGLFNPLSELRTLFAIGLGILVGSLILFLLP